MKDVVYGPVQDSHNKSSVKVISRDTELWNLPALCLLLLKDFFLMFYVWCCVKGIMASRTEGLEG